MKRTAILCAGLLTVGFLQAQTAPKFDPTDFIVVGEGLAAGFADFTLKDTYQQQSFPAQMALQMNTAFVQPLIQLPGIGSAVGFAQAPIRIPGTLQGSVREPFPPDFFIMNLSVPGETVNDSLNRRPGYPMIQRGDLQQTLTNMILGYPAMIVGPSNPLYTQADYAVAMNPTLVLVELGYYEVLNAAVNDNPSLLPTTSAFSGNYATLLSRLRANGATVIVTTVPNPFDTAYFTPLSAATNYVGAPASLLSSLYGYAPTVYLTPTGLTYIGDQIFSSIVYPPLLPTSNITVSAATATAVQAAVTALNSAINSAAQTAGAKVYDLNAFFHKMNTNGLTAGTTQLNANYLGGIYSLDGYYPGTTAQTAIANDILTFINTNYSTSYKTIDLSTIVTTDPAVRLIPLTHRRKGEVK